MLQMRTCLLPAACDKTRSCCCLSTQLLCVSNLSVHSMPLTQQLLKGSSMQRTQWAQQLLLFLS
jgi:hypothetical protein